MEQPEVVIQAFFARGSGVPDVPEFVGDATAESFMGLRLWKPEGRPVYAWAVEYVALPGKRWCVFGPMPRDKSMGAVLALSAMPGWRGARVVNEHLFATIINRFRPPEENPQRAWIGEIRRDFSNACKARIDMLACG